MKSILLSSAVIALLVFSGCSKEPMVDESVYQHQSENVIQPETTIDTETVSSDNISVDTSNGMNDEFDNKEMRMANLEKEFSNIYFDFDKFLIRSDMKENLSLDAKLANGKASNLNIKLEGNCDEWGSDEYNFALGLKRANTTKDALIAEGVAANRISMISYGETNPTCSDKTQECWSKNRRVDFKLLP
jgi:peptidoglycan-associated lipoprotein